MFYNQGKRCKGCIHEKVDVKSKNFNDRMPCIDCSRLYKDYFVESEEAKIPEDKFICIKCHKVIDANNGMRSTTNFKKGICFSCFNKT